MILFPAIDLIGGKVVRLAQGKRSHMDVYADNPVQMAQEFAAQGATWIHVVDLSRTLGEDAAACAANTEAIRALCEVPGLSVDVGGGVRDLATVEHLLELGARRIAIGTALVRDTAFAREAVREFGDLLVADVAAQAGRVQVNGWRDETSLPLDELVARLVDMGYCRLVFTDVARDGMQCGIDTDTYAHLAQLTGFPVVASGGIATLADLRALAVQGPQVIEGIICGRALYEKTFTVKEALNTLHDAENGTKR